jgi:hypothetical protein
LVVLARFLATAVVTLLCKRLSDMGFSFSGVIDVTNKNYVFPKYESDITNNNNPLSIKKGSNIRYLQILILLYL